MKFYLEEYGSMIFIDSISMDDAKEILAYLREKNGKHYFTDMDAICFINVNFNREHYVTIRDKRKIAILTYDEAVSRNGKFYEQ